MNMSYCRFNNTNIDLKECLDTLSSGEETLSKSEFECCKDMFQTFIEFCYDEGIIEDDNVELHARLEEFFDGINRE